MIEYKGGKGEPILESADGYSSENNAFKEVRENKTDKNRISNHTEIILAALHDYRKWFTENADSERDLIKKIDEAVEFVQSI